MTFNYGQKVLSGVLIAFYIFPASLSQTTTPTTIIQQNDAGIGGGNNGQPAFSCFRYFGMALGVVQSLGLDSADLCTNTGAFWSAMSQGQECMSTSVTSVPVPVFTAVNTALSRCNAAISQSSASVCASFAAQGAPCPAQSSYFAQGAISTTRVPTTTTTTTTTPTPAQTISPQPTATSVETPVANSTGASASASTSTESTHSTPTATAIPTQGQPTQNADNRGRSNVGLVAGVAIGAALGTLILAVVLGVFLWRYRRKQRNRRSDMIPFAAPPTLDPKPLPPLKNPEAAHLELESPISDSKTPVGPPVFVRTLGGLQELDSMDTRMKEMLAETEMIARGTESGYGWKTWYSSGTSLSDPTEQP